MLKVFEFSTDNIAIKTYFFDMNLIKNQLSRDMM